MFCLCVPSSGVRESVVKKGVELFRESGVFPLSFSTPHEQRFEYPSGAEIPGFGETVTDRKTPFLLKAGSGTQGRRRRKMEAAKMSFGTGVGDKTHLFASVIPMRKQTYCYYNEEHYYDLDYRRSLFAYTNKKCGWDANRHLEILHNKVTPLYAVTK